MLIIILVISLTTQRKEILRKWIFLRILRKWMGIKLSLITLIAHFVSQLGYNLGQFNYMYKKWYLSLHFIIQHIYNFVFMLHNSIWSDPFFFQLLMDNLEMGYSGSMASLRCQTSTLASHAETNFLMSQFQIGLHNVIYSEWQQNMIMIKSK